eukprot:9022503-Alexandrium_andersonii.AAC.1
MLDRAAQGPPKPQCDHEALASSPGFPETVRCLRKACLGPQRQLVAVRGVAPVASLGGAVR